MDGLESVNTAFDRRNNVVLANILGFYNLNLAVGKDDFADLDTAGYRAGVGKDDSFDSLAADRRILLKYLVVYTCPVVCSSLAGFAFGCLLIERKLLSMAGRFSAAPAGTAAK